MAEICFDVSDADRELISRITKRASEMAIRAGEEFDKLECAMDVTAVHANGCELNLPKLLAAREGDFRHDIGGISQHLDRKTGKLRDHFLPRCAS